MENQKNDSNSTYLDVDVEDISDVLKVIERSFAIQFEKNELQKVRTFGQLCDIILVKLNFEGTYDCTTQQTFYKLRNEIMRITGKSRDNIKVNTKLSSIFPIANRSKHINELEQALGFKLHILKPRNFSIVIFISLLIISGSLFLISWQYGIIAISLSIFFYLLLLINPKEFRLTNLGELSEEIVMENYFKIKKNPSNGNHKEVIRLIEKIFLRDLATDLEHITSEVIIVEYASIRGSVSNVLISYSEHFKCLIFSIYIDRSN